MQRFEKYAKKTFLSAFLLLTPLAGICAANGNVTIGVFAYQGERAAIADWSPVITYLDRMLPSHRFHLQNYDAQDLRQAIAAHQIDLVITNPGYYVTMESEFGLSRIATLAALTGATSAGIGSVVLTRADRGDLRTLADLAGKRIAAVSAQGFAGYLIVAREMREAGVDPETDLKEMHFLGLPMNRIIDAIENGQVDAGIVRACVPEQMSREGLLTLTDFKALSPKPAASFDCLLSTRLYPEWPIAVTRQTDPALAKAVARALLAMPEGKGNISWSVPADYQPVHDLYRELRLGPYAYLRDITPEGLIRRFWPWLAATLGTVLGVLLVWAIHTVRVSQLVHRRTAQLTASLLARDIAENRARDNQERMDHLSRLSILGELSGNLAHEINQPLTSIGTYARTVLRRQESGKLTPGAITEACSEIAREADRAGGIVQRIRHFAKRRPTSRERIDLHDIAGEAAQLLLGMLANPPIIDIASLPVAPETEGKGIDADAVLADGQQIQQVLLNLLKNAIDAGRELPPDQQARQTIHIKFEIAENRIVTHVIDRGPGMDATQFDHLFEAFFTSKPDGLGLGLPICKSIIETHGGRLWAEFNADGAGMRFSFSLPLPLP